MMMTVFPVEGRLVRDPFTRLPVPPEGQGVDDADPYWARALADGDVADAQVDAPVVAPADTQGEVLKAAETIIRDLTPVAAPAAPSVKG